jgi:hypothetical protein
MTHTLQELETMCAAASPGPWKHLGGRDFKTWDGGDTVSARTTEDAVLMVAARVSIPELIARIRELDPEYHVGVRPEIANRVADLARDSAEKRAKLDHALIDAKLGDTAGLDTLGLEAFFEDDGTVKIRAKPRAQTP